MRATDFAKPLQHFQELLHRRGIVIVISDFYEEPETIVRAIEPLRFRGNEVVLFHILDPQEIRPVLKGSSDPGRSRDRAEDRSDSGIREDDLSREDGRAHRAACARARGPRAWIISCS